MIQQKTFLHELFSVEVVFKKRLRNPQIKLGHKIISKFDVTLERVNKSACGLSILFEFVFLSNIF